MTAITFDKGALKGSLGPLQDSVDAAFDRFERRGILERIWNLDHRVWKEDPREIVNRLGWLQSPQKMKSRIPEIKRFVHAVQTKGYDTAVLLGMGGSSLAAEVFRLIYGVKAGHPDLMVLDSTDPDAVAALTKGLVFPRTLFIVSTKSGTTVETLSFMKYFYTLVLEKVGRRHAGDHFVAVTDPGSRLERRAAELHFMKVFLNDPHIGGRYSALSCFGLVPAALIGLDMESILAHAAAIATPRDRTAAYLGILMGELSLRGKDKLTLVLPPAIEPFGAWLEQLIAESLGKEGKGILPVIGEPLAPPEKYRNDRLFVRIKPDGEDPFEEPLAALMKAGHPVVTLDLESLDALSGEFFRWMMATAVAGAHMGIHPFDQPNVEAAKTRARKLVSVFLHTGKLPEAAPDFEEKGIQVYLPSKAHPLQEVLERLFSGIPKTDAATGYVALQAYLKPDAETDRRLQMLRCRIRDRYRLAVTVGYGPRFLHSTGQLHKGDAGLGLFVQLTADSKTDVTIPDEVGAFSGKLTFGVLKLAQALGDRQALLEAGRTVIRFHLKGNVGECLEQLIGLI